eukprot:CAMPEP_0181445842 /NCGR_PEP_ID=MMETSP1110-20121109/25796_1 /TAXON_ID=174948 /ORGANISM="Symbiodinium sp., Strain CCMP421" /LENGTH=291 /DNA_ID=CAMNT_0023569899 /DNA_START=166 /DNA_END=1041 /DNA_ORIENTATION=+
MEQGRYAVHLIWLSQSILDEPVTQAGLRFIGLGNALLEYPSTFQTMYFTTTTQGVQATSQSAFPPIVKPPIRARSKDGLEMYVTISFQWKLEPQALKPLYYLLGEDGYDDAFVRFARAALINTCSYFPADMYFTNRTIITAKMLEDLENNFQKPEKGLQTTIKGLQLQDVDLPDEFDVEIANTQTQLQELEVAFAERVEREVAMQTELLVSTQQVLKRLETQRGEARGYLELNQAQVDQQLLFQERQALANNEILKIFENDTQPYERLFELMEIRMLQGHNSENLMFSLPN